VEYNLNAYLLRIKKLIEGKKISESAFARAIDVNQKTINDMFRRDSTPKVDIMNKISSAYGVNLIWLLTGEGEMFRQKEPPSKESLEEEADEFPEDIERGLAILDYLQGLLIKKGLIEESDNLPPLPGVRRVNYADRMTDETYRMLQRQLVKAQREAERVQQETERIKSFLKRYEAGHSGEASEPKQEYGPPESIPLYEPVAAGEPLESFDAKETCLVPLSRLHGNPEQYFAVRIRGESMVDAGIYDNSIVVIRKEIDLINGRIYLFRHEGEYTLKRYRLGDDMQPRLLYEDGSGREVELHEGEDWEVIGVFCFVG